MIDIEGIMTGQDLMHIELVKAIVQREITENLVDVIIHQVLITLLLVHLAGIIILKIIAIAIRIQEVIQVVTPLLIRLPLDHHQDLHEDPHMHTITLLLPIHTILDVLPHL